MKEYKNIRIIIVTHILALGNRFFNSGCLVAGQVIHVWLKLCSEHRLKLEL